MKWGITKRNNDPINTLDVFRRDMDRFFDDFFSIGPSSLSDSSWVPTIDIDEDDKALHVKAEIPGIDEKDLEVKIQDDMLIISGEKKEEKKEEKKNYVMSERRFGSFYRSIPLPYRIEGDRVSAKFKNGVLSIDIPKSGEKSEKRVKIDVQ